MKWLIKQIYVFFLQFCSSFPILHDKDNPSKSNHPSHPEILHEIPGLKDKLLTRVS